MAVNKNALIRYRTIDKCLQNTARLWTLDDLIEACSDALYEFEGRDINVSKRTLQLDIQTMRSDKLGYNAPIEVYDRKYYRYEDEDYSITTVPLSQNDMNVLSETMDMLRQFKDFSLFQEFRGIFNKLEDRIHTEQHHKPTVILLDSNPDLKGLELLDELYHAILKETVLDIMYQSFTAQIPTSTIFHPYFLREFNNRWFLVGRRPDSKKIITFALDRIMGVDFLFDEDYIPCPFDAEEYYKNTIGVTVLNDQYLKNITFKVDCRNAPYVLTKPFHRSQQVIEKCEDGAVIFRIKVHTNYELERLLLGFGECLEVLSPRRLRRKLSRKFEMANRLYTSERINDT